MKKKILSTIIAAAMLTATVPTFAETPIEQLRDLGVIEGFDNGELGEGYNLTRAQAITIIMRATGFDDAKWYKAEIRKFDDMPISHWASGYVYKGVSLDMVDGVTDREYLPESNVTYEQAVKLLVCLLGYGSDDMAYPDGYLKKAEELGLLKGVSASVGQELTRGEFSALVYNAVNCAPAEGDKLIAALEKELETVDDEKDEYYRYDDLAVADGMAIAESAAMEPAMVAGGAAAKDGGGGGGIKAGSAGMGTGSVTSGMPDPGYPIIDDPSFDDPQQITPGQLTAGRWSDYENYDFWNELMQDQDYYEMQHRWEIPIDRDRISPDPDESEDILDLMFTIDTTGSMGDELRYIKEELKDVVLRLDTNVRLSCNYYRDTGDTYTVKPFPFTTNVDKVVGQISRQYASGGGDYPEAVDLALLDSVNEHDWSVSARSRLLFLVLDAPPHYTDEVVENIKTAVNSAVEKGIHIIPIASSGVDKDTEFFLRSLALATGGTYIFLTDDSGIGYSHIKPTIGDYDVEYLNELLLKTIKEYIHQDYDVVIETPEPTALPAETEEPVETEEPAETEEPEETEEPLETEEPEETDEPEETEEPEEPSEEPEAEPQGTDK